MMAATVTGEGRQIDLARAPPFRIGALTVEPAVCRVVRGKVSTPLEPRVMQVLVLLAGEAPRVVSRDMMIQRCWQGRIVGDDAINRVVGRLRSLAREDEGRSFSIQTLNKVGYRLVGDVELADAGADGRRAAPAPLGAEPAVPPVAPPRPGDYLPAIAVLPFGHPVDDPDQVYFAEGMAEDIINGLAHARMLRVISPLSSLAYRRQEAGARQICSDLGVRYLVRGQIRRMAGTLRMSVSLTDGETDETIWSARFDRPIGELFAVQSEVAAGIIGAIEPAILEHEQFLVKSRPPSLEFWDLFIRARYHFWKGTIASFQQATTLLHQALTMKPDDSAALSLMAMVNLSKVWAGNHPEAAQLVARAQALAQRAVAADNRNPMAHHVLGVVLAQFGQHEQAVAAQRRSLQLNPYNPQAQGELARLIAFGGGDADEVIALADGALQASPTDPHDWLWLRSKSIALLLAGRADEALQQAREACARRPDYFFLHLLVAATAAAAGDMESARTALTRGQEMHPHYTLKGLRLGHPFTREADLQRFVDALRMAGWHG
jgi:TolB-like protein/DNA-binding winged helix-turn-helix (wHTH) protein